MKNIGKVSNPKVIDILAKITSNDKDSMVRREAVSSIGRMRLPQSEPILIQLLNKRDPKIILQHFDFLHYFLASTK